MWKKKCLINKGACLHLNFKDQAL